MGGKCIADFPIKRAGLSMKPPTAISSPSAPSRHRRGRHARGEGAEVQLREEEANAELFIEVSHAIAGRSPSRGPSALVAHDAAH